MSTAKATCKLSPEMHKLSESLLFDRYPPILDAAAHNETHIDVHEPNFAVAMDFLTAYIFGLNNGSNFLGDAHYRKHWLALYNSRRAHEFWPQELPELTSSLSKLGIHVVPKHVKAANPEIEAWCLKLCSKAATTRTHNATSPTSPQPATKPPISPVYAQLSQSFASQPSPQQPHLPPASELMDHSLASHEKQPAYHCPTSSTNSPSAPFSNPPSAPNSSPSLPKPNTHNPPPPITHASRPRTQSTRFHSRTPS